MSYSKIHEVCDMPNLIGIQLESYKWFVEEGLAEVLEDISPIESTGTKPRALEFTDYYFSDVPNESQEECKRKNKTYNTTLKVKARLISKDTGVGKEQEVFMGEFPLMTEKGTFIYNGAERAIVTQLVRSPGPYFDAKTDKSSKSLFSASIIPNRGAWLEYETDSQGAIYVHVDRQKKVPITTFLRALDFGSNEDIEAIFREDMELLRPTLEKDPAKNCSEGILEIYKTQRPGDLATIANARKFIESLLFDKARYDLAKVGRYKYNKKLGLHNRLVDMTAAEDIIDPNTGEILVEEGEKISRPMAMQIEDAGVYAVSVMSNDPDKAGKTARVIGNNFVDPTKYVDFDVKPFKLSEKVYYEVLKDILDNAKDEDEIKEAFRERKQELSPKHITKADIIASISYLLNLENKIGELDDIDHLGNRRLKTVGELLQNQFMIGFTRMEKTIKEKMASDEENPRGLINIKPVTTAVKEFFGQSQLSQFVDQNNPLAEITHKRRLSALGRGGLSRERAGFEVRDVHYSHYGRMCPIETPEGPNIGLIGSLTTYGRINEYGLIETPYRKVDKERGIVTEEVEYLSADDEELMIIAQANEPLNADGSFANNKVAVRGYKGEITMSHKSEVDYMDVSPKQVVSVATAMIPFLENDDANRALMGSNMQRQAVPLLVTEAPYIGTGIEYKAAIDSGAVVVARSAGTVEYVSADLVKIKRDSDGGIDEYKLLKFCRSNQGTCINQRPIVNHGEHIEEGEVVADGQATNMGEISLGKNLLIGFMTWEGYNYEDAIILNERLLMDDVLTSIHIEKYECEARDTKLGKEEITADISSVSKAALRNLDADGIIRVGAEVKPGDILVGKLTPKSESDIPADLKLVRAIFGEKSKEARDTSLKVPNGEEGVVIHVDVFTSEDESDEENENYVVPEKPAFLADILEHGDSDDAEENKKGKRRKAATKNDMPPGVEKIVRVYVATKRKISIGDKMAGRHGNKGVISTILPEEDMPFLDNGESLQVMLNPLGVPSRMNIGQVLEVHLGLAAKAKGWYISTPVFDGASEQDVIELLEECGYPKSGKLKVRDGRTGEYFDNDVTVGYMYMLKLHHLVDDKIHARSTGPYALVTQQPLGGKAQFGGQRFGEMEVWALEAYGAAHTLQEILTVKSDDIIGRVKTYEAIVKGENIPEPGIPESFKVLIKELQSLALDIRVLSGDNEEIHLKETSEYDEAPTVERMLKETDRKAAARREQERDVDELSEFIGEATGSFADDFEGMSTYGSQDELADVLGFEGTTPEKADDGDGFEAEDDLESGVESEGGIDGDAEAEAGEEREGDIEGGDREDGESPEDVEKAIDQGFLDLMAAISGSDDAPEDDSEESQDDEE